MADDEHVAILKKGVAAWNKWRKENPDILQPELSKADFTGADLNGAKLNGAYLSEAKLAHANLREANLRKANLHEAELSRANLNLADLTKADLRGANLENAALVDTILTDADLTGCRIYGVSAWGLKLDGATQQTNLVITRVDEPEITVDNLEVAQFIYLMLHNEKIRDVIDTIAKKGVLILGRFTDERKAVLDALREELRVSGQRKGFAAQLGTLYPRRLFPLDCSLPAFGSVLPKMRLWVPQAIHRA
jgi:hypothetical protein